MTQRTRQTTPRQLLAQAGPEATPCSDAFGGSAQTVVRVLDVVVVLLVVLLPISYSSGSI